MNKDLKIFTKNIEEEAMNQINELLKQEPFKDCKVRIMPDVHAGKGCVIGFTADLGDKVIPNIVGVDIGCFTGDTEVWLTSHYEKIKDMAESGEAYLIESYSEKLGYFIYTNATARKTRENANLIKVSYKSKFGYLETVRCTLDHKFLVETQNGDEWIEAQYLVSDMKLKSEDLDVRVIDTEYLDEKEDVYCLTVPETHNFLIKGGIVVHNCGMLCVELGNIELDLEKLDKVINEYIPSGRNIREHKLLDFEKINDLYCLRELKETKKFNRAIGTLGGGNHFIEIDIDDEGNKYLVIHTGSRNLGKQVADYYQNLAIELCSGKKEMYQKKEEIIKTYKEQGRKSEIQKALKELEKEYKNNKPSLPKDLCYLEGEYRESYLHDMKICQEYASLNRKCIAGEIISKYFSDVFLKMNWYETIHNYISFEDNIVRKGAISAKKGEKVLIPINMRDGSIIAIGKGNEDWNCSAPHGAGRIMSRIKAKETFKLEEFKESMKDVYSTSVVEETIDEAPFVYKPIQEIIDNIQDTVEIVKIIRPIYNFKAKN